MFFGATGAKKGTKKGAGFVRIKAGGACTAEVLCYARARGELYKYKKKDTPRGADIVRSASLVHGQKKESNSRGIRLRKEIRHRTTLPQSNMQYHRRWAPYRSCSGWERELQARHGHRKKRIKDVSYNRLGKCCRNDKQFLVNWEIAIL